MTNSVSVGVAYQDPYLKNAVIEDSSTAFGTSSVPISRTTSGN